MHCLHLIEKRILYENDFDMVALFNLMFHFFNFICEILVKSINFKIVVWLDVLGCDVIRLIVCYTLNWTDKQSWTHTFELFTQIITTRLNVPI